MPPEATGFGLPLGPLVMLTVSEGAAADTACVYDPDLLLPWPSLAITEIKQFCEFPEVFVGAVQIGVRLVTLLKVPLEPRFEQDDVQA